MTKSENRPAQNAVVQMIAMMADTTWRMFVPILGLLLVGVFVDKAHATFPWFSLLGFVLGTGVSGLLVRSQLRRGRKELAEKVAEEETREAVR